MSDPSPDPVATRYLIGGKLAQSGPIQIVAAHDRLLHRRVGMAICDGSIHECSTFTRQGQAVGRISSKFIVNVYDSGNLDGRPYVVFERPAFTFAEIFNSEDHLHPPVNLPEVARQLEEAIACFRLAGVDVGVVRPSIIGVTEDGQLRMSPWPLDEASEADSLMPAAFGLTSDEMQIPALLAMASGGETQYVPSPDSWADVGMTDTQTHVPVASSDPVTAPVDIVRGHGVRPGGPRRMRRSRRPLVASAAAVIVLVTLTTVVLASLSGRPGVLGQKGHGPAAGATISKVSTTTTTMTDTNLPSSVPATTGGPSLQNGSTGSTNQAASVTPATNAVNASPTSGVAQVGATTTTTTTAPTAPPPSSTTTTTAASSPPPSPPTTTTTTTTVNSTPTSDASTPSPNY